MLNAFLSFAQIESRKADGGDAVQVEEPMSRQTHSQSPREQHRKEDQTEGQLLIIWSSNAFQEGKNHFHSANSPTRVYILTRDFRREATAS